MYVMLPLTKGHLSNHDNCLAEVVSLFGQVMQLTTINMERAAFPKAGLLDKAISKCMYNCM